MLLVPKVSYSSYSGLASNSGLGLGRTPILVLEQTQTLRRVPFTLTHLNTEACAVACLTVATFLYHLGNWRRVALLQMRNSALTAFMTTTLINIIHVTSAQDGEEWDAPPNLDEFPEMVNFKVFLEPLLRQEFGSTETRVDETDWRVNLLRNRPLSFAVVAGLEVLSRWAEKGILLNAKISTDREPVTIAESIVEYR